MHATSALTKVTNNKNKTKSISWAVFKIMPKAIFESFIFPLLSLKLLNVLLREENLTLSNNSGAASFKSSTGKVIYNFSFSFFIKDRKLGWALV